MGAEPPVVDIRDLEYTWRGAAGPILRIARLYLAPAERMFVKGPSGSGKSTLLGLVAGVNVPCSGTVRVLDRSLGSMGGSTRDQFRADHMGVIFQQFNLLPYLSVIENVLLPCRFSRRRLENASARGDALTEAKRLLEHLDIGPDLLHQRASDLSVGQQQRVAAARALIGGPELVIADEPTSSLDADRRSAFVKLLFRECGETGSALMFVSHDDALEPLFDRSVHLDEINEAG
ncbi:MAG: ABC transporter ATP-binding protein [Gammaproteobacteria bacterium]|nr:ABC transporter ATP-binding protein [Gammaproteobacteria bacterium]MBU1655877.1 ABC transporter ATP-binding protein [Gammaproteobacteria bacterium]MBU1960620.1 ABC transporter ATP-binding protein [Gammaproteobacteria bacterium]